eukprot:753179-Hanusia_phi.AAC.5
MIAALLQPLMQPQFPGQLEPIRGFGFRPAAHHHFDTWTCRSIHDRYSRCMGKSGESQRRIDSSRDLQGGPAGHLSLRHKRFCRWPRSIRRDCNFKIREFHLRGLL